MIFDAKIAGRENAQSYRGAHSIMFIDWVAVTWGVH